MIHTPTLDIRAAELADVAEITAMINLPGVRDGTLQMPYDSSLRVTQRISEAAGDHLLVGTLRDKDGQAAIVAYGGLFPGVRRRRHVGEVFLIVHDDHTGRGYGGSLLTALIDLADNWLGLKRLELDVNTDNPAAIHLYEKHGFEIEGTKRGDAMRDGALTDAHIMGRLHEAALRR